MKIQSQVYILVALGVVSTDAWFWSRTGPTTLAPTPAVESEGSGSPADSGDPPTESSAKLRAEIIDEGHDFYNVVQTWNETTVAPVLTTPMQLQNENGSEPEPAGISSPISKPVAKVYPLALGRPSTTRPNDHIKTPTTTLNQTAEGSVEPGESPQCLLLDTALPFCSVTGEYFLVPNYLNHTTVAEVQCGSLVPLLPCRRFCEVLKDSCWSLLDEGRLPVECHALPDEEDDGYQCLSVSNQKEDNGVSLLQLIGDPPPPEITQVDGPENSPAYVFGPDANTGQLARAHLPSPFYRDFALIFHLKSSSNKGGVVFSITDASQQIMYVGVKLSDVQGRNQNIILFYTEPGSEESYEAASFPVPSTVNTWTRFAIAVRDDKVMFYFNCEVDPLVMPIERSPDEMELEAGAGVFIGQAGGADPGKFLGVISELRVVGDPRVAERYCEEDGDDSDMASGEGSGYEESRPPKPEEKHRWTEPLEPKEKRVTEGREERKEAEVLVDLRAILALVPAPGAGPVEKREKQEQREKRAVQALATRGQRESQALLGHLAPQDL
ncbi:Collagen alpha-1(XVIII) chain [Takifugu flavidus]|uniref:Collagen alpha-1(XVIII) chain n=1 Tax=Takifugu flavidus TaxID=433684 RepID=A0A5C6PM66_9TELE|nr:Collagen alpha-1(XVIII) chain [Takifugu flavidus]